MEDSSSELVKSFEALNLTNGLTRCVKNNIYRLVRPCFFAGYRGKMVDFARYSDHDNGAYQLYLRLWKVRKTDTLFGVRGSLGIFTNLLIYSYE